MIALLPALVVTCFSLSVGFLSLLVWIERPLLSIIWDVASAKVKDTDIRRVHSVVHVIAQADGPTIAGIYQVTGMVLSVVQAWQCGFDWAALLCSAIAVVHVLYSLRNIGAVLKSAKGTGPEDEASSVRIAIRKEIIFHHTGFAMCVVILLLQLLLVMRI